MHDEASGFANFPTGTDNINADFSQCVVPVSPPLLRVASSFQHELSIFAVAVPARAPRFTGNTWREVPPSHVFGLRVESQTFQCRMLCFAKTMSTGAVYLRERCNARAWSESSQVNGSILSVWCILNLLASQLHQPMEQTRVAQISWHSVYASRTSPPPSVMLQDQTTCRTS